MKLTLKELAPYLPYELKYKVGHIENGIYTLIDLGIMYVQLISDIEGEEVLVRSVEEATIKPILRPLSDLNKSVFYEKYNENRVLMEDHIIFKRLSKKDFLSGKLEAYYHLTLLENYEIITYLFELHFDVFGLIEQGLAIDINTINPNP